MTKSTRKPPLRKESSKIKRRQAPGITIASRENQLINLSAELAEKQLRSGSASSQVITHFLKLGSTQALLEKAKLEQENLLLLAKTESLQSQKRVEELYAKAMKAFRTYAGQEDLTDEDL